MRRPTPKKTWRRWLVPAAVVVVVAVGAWVGFRQQTGGAGDQASTSGVPSGGVSEVEARPQPTPRASEKPPVNIVLFLIDTLRADRLGAYGYDAHETSPNIDALARLGVVFEHAGAPAPWTIPSVASMFTSTPPCEHNMLGKFDRLPETADTLAERLARLGYTNHSLIGNEFLGPKFGLAQGFHNLVGGGRNGGKRVSDALGPAPPLPFFVYIHNMEPHDPYHFAPPHTPGFRDVSREVREQMKFHFKAYKKAAEYDYRRQQPLGTTDLTAEQDEHRAVLDALRADWSELYDASVRYGDTHVGTLISMLRTRGYWDNTLFIVVADHGEELNDHGSWLHDQSVYDELMRVPLVVRFPHDEFAGQRISEPVSLIDVLPTIFDYLGRPDLATGSRGRSLMPLVRGTAPQRSSPFLIPGLRINVTRFYRPWVETRGDVNIVIRRDHWKGIWNVDIDTFELYDLRSDPLERRNIQGDHGELVEAMRVYAQDWYARCQESTQQTEDVGELDEETLRKLRSLGYVD